MINPHDDIPGETVNQTFEVTFLDHDGSVLSEQTIEEGKNAIAPANPIRENYTFMGWDQTYLQVTRDLVIRAMYELIIETNHSAIVSGGVDPLDLGNIMSGQYYFATDDMLFYASFDTNDESHIYASNSDGTDLKPIFDGFGWSLVVIDDWLYFSGNQGTTIDGTYHLSRMRFDGSQLEEINDQYSYGMFLYGDQLYYMQRIDDGSTQMSIYRSDLDGSNKQMVVNIGYAPVIYDYELYYMDADKAIYKADPDGSNRQLIVESPVNFYVISQDLIIYIKNNHIYTSNLDGSNQQLIVSLSEDFISNLNVYKGSLFYAIYDVNFNYSFMGYHYQIYSCKLDGSDKKMVFSSVSYGIYINVVNDKLMLMDYAQLTSSSAMIAIIKVMNLDGSEQTIMSR